MSIETSAPAHELHGVSPHLVCGGAAEAINFYKHAFGAEELTRLPEPDGKIIHACLRINGATVTLSDEFPDFGMVGDRQVDRHRRSTCRSPTSTPPSPGRSRPAPP